MAQRGLKKFITGLLGRTETDENSSRVEPQETGFEQTIIRLQQLVEERSFVEVRFPDRAQNTYQSLILKVDAQERFVVIDELFPAHGAFFISPGDEVEITSVRRGIPVRFNTWVKSISLDEQDGFPAYRLALPDVVEATQRRKNFRVTIDPDAGVRLRIRNADGEKVLCSVHDLSHNGIGFTCQGNLTDRLRENNTLRASVLSIPGVTDITCDIEVRSFEFRRQPYRHMMIGARMEGLNTTTDKQLEQFLLLAQRQQRREASRSTF